MSREREARSRDFDFLVGSWTLEHRRLGHRLVRATDWELFEGTAVCRRVLDGIGNVDEITLPALDAVGMTIRLYNPATEVWSLHWASSRTGVFEPPVVGRFDGGIGRFYGDDEHDGQPIRVRYVWVSPASRMGPPGRGGEFRQERGTSPAPVMGPLRRQ